MPMVYFLAGLTFLLWGSVAYLGTHLSRLPIFFLIGTTLLIGSMPALLKWRHFFPNIKNLSVGIFGIFGYHIFFLSGLRLAPPIEVTLLNYLWPVLLLLFSHWILRFTLTKYHWIGSALAFLGCFFAVSGGQLHFHWQYFNGYLCGLIAAFIWALYSVLVKKIAHQNASAMGGICFISGILSLVVHFLMESRPILLPSDYFLLIFMGIGPMGASFYFWEYCMRKGDPRIISAMSYLTPLFSISFLVFLGNQELHKSYFIALVLILGGALMGSKELFSRR